nr:AbrB family transcriptional regulator [Klebsiella pneumoniae subsp. pneumoniae]
MHLGVASRDRALADIAAALFSSSLLLRIHLPAALLLGPLIAGLILSLRGVKLSIPRPCYLVAQAIVGCMIARAINPLFLACCSTTGRWCWRSC